MIGSPIKEAKDPTDVKDYQIDWTDVLTAEGETAIDTSSWAASDPSGLTLVDGSPASGYIDGLKTIIWVSGGTAGTRYSLTNTIVTAGPTPRTHQRSIIIPCVQR